MEKPLFYAAFLFALIFASRVYSTSFRIAHAIRKSQRGKNKTSKTNKGSDRRCSGKDCRKGKTMKINMNKKTIELNKAEMKKAMVFGNVEYDNLQIVRRDYPNFKVVEIKVKKNNSDFANLKMDDIKGFVEKYGSEEQKASFAFISKRSVDEDGEYCEPQSFFQIKTWFLNEFPEFKQIRKDYRQKIVSIYDAASAKKSA